MLPLIRKELVERHRFLSEDVFLEILSLAQSLPGALAINTASFAGFALGGVSMQLLAVFATALPSFLSIVAIASFFLRFRELHLVQAFFQGALAVVVSLIVLAVFQVGEGIARDRVDLVMALFLFILLVATGVHPLFIVLLGGGLGVLFRR